MKRFLLLLIVLMHAAFVCSAQFENNYSPLECKGKIPERILSSLREKMKSTSLSQVDMKQRKGEKRLRNKYAIETNFVLDRLLQSGAVLFNDEVSVYLNSVAQELLKMEEVELRNKIVIYTLRSTAVNAFATERGDIFVTLGLLAKLNNKSELAFVLAHEMSHVVQHHNLNKYIVFEKKSKSDRKKDGVKDGGFLSTSELLKHCLYSRALESEADSLGTIRYLEAGFNPDHLFKVFDVLETAHLPFSKEEFPYKIFETLHFKISDSIKNVKADIIPKDMNDNDSLSSHPGIRIRREMVKGLLASNLNRNQLPTAIDNYGKIQRIARFEMPWLYLKEQKLPMAVYTAGCLLNEFPNNSYLQLCVAQGLYLRAVTRNKGTFPEGEWHFDQGSKSIDSLMRGLSRKSLNYLSLYYTLNLAKQQNTEEVYAILDDLKEMNHDAFEKTSRDSTDYYPLQDILPKGNMEKGLEDEISQLKRPSQLQQNDTVMSRKILLLNPEFLSIDNRRTGEIEYLQTETGQKNVANQMYFAAGKSNLTIERLDVKDLKENEVTKFNDIRYLSDYMSLQNTYPSRRNLSLPGKRKVKEIMAKYQSNHVLISGFVSVHESNYSFLLLPISVILWPTLPLTIKSMLTPKYNLVYFSVLDDVDQNEMELINYNYFNVKENNTLLKAHTYHTFYSIGRILNTKSK